MNYQALYRKYRPKNFNEVAGQNITIKILKNAIVNKKIAHAYLFYGPRGTGKTSIAKIFARTINCDDNKEGIMCENCNSCNISKNKECIDIIEIDAASNNGVDEIRELKNKVSFVPNELKYKVYIIDEVHMLSIGAFNALLKTLEEPPEHVVFILATTELNKVPTTIISRCQTLEFKKIDNDSMINKLKYIAEKENIKIDDESLKEISKYSNGGLRDAIGLLEKTTSYSDKIDIDIVREVIGNISQKQFEQFLSFINDKNIEEVIKMVNDFYVCGVDLIKIAYNLIEYFRDYLINNKKYDKNICSFILELDEAINKMEKSDNPKIIFEILLINYLSTDKDSNEMKQTINNTEQIKNKINETKTENVNQDDDKELNSDIKKIRVGNTLCDPQKNIIETIRNSWKNLMDLAFDPELGNLSRLLCTDIKPVAASQTNIIVVTKLNGTSLQINNSLDDVEKILKKAMNVELKPICLTEIEWKNYTEIYKKDKNSFTYIEEQNKKKEKKTLKEKAKELFDE